MSNVSLPVPCGPDSLTGFEVELLAPPGKSRLGLARAIADAARGRVVGALKYLQVAASDAGEPIDCCELVPQFSVLDANDEWLCTVVDDLTVRRDLDPRAPATPAGWRLVMDDARLARMAERMLSIDVDASPETALAPLLSLFGADIGAYGEGASCDPNHRLVRDGDGNVIAVVAPYGEGRERVAELVTRPLLRDERFRLLAEFVGIAKELGFTAPVDGGMHVHLDAAPWRSTARCRNFILAYAAEREALNRELSPNPATARWRGPFSRKLIEVATDAVDSLPFAAFQRWVLAARPMKSWDINLLGVVRARHPQATLEARIFPVDFDIDRVKARVDCFEQFAVRVAKASAR